MGITRRTRQQIAAEAVDWFLQFQEKSAVAPDRQSFSEWLLRSPAHVEEYLRVSCSWSLADVAAAGDLEAVAHGFAHQPEGLMLEDPYLAIIDRSADEAAAG